MFCSKCGKEIKEGEKVCSNCGSSVSEGKKKSSKIILTVTVILIIAICVCIFIFTNRNKTKDENGFELTSSNVITNASSISFFNMNPDDENLDETQKAILQYFDSYNDYFWASPDILQRYPQVFEKTKISLGANVVKVLKSTNEEFEILVFEDEFGYYWGPNKTAEYTLNGSSERLCIIRGEQLEERVLESDRVFVGGRYVGVETREIDGITYTLPVINSIKLEAQHIIEVASNKEAKDQAKIIRKVAEHVFGKDIKISYKEPIENPMYDIEGGYQGVSIIPGYYLATLDNQSNANFKAFKMGDGYITYDKEYNNLSDNIQKTLFISADFNHFIVTTYDSNLRYVYIDYFDKSLNKLWSREFEYNSNDLSNVSPMDYTQDKLAIVVDNDLYLIDLKTGENVFEPAIVGFKTRVIMMSDGIILIGKENKDLIMKLDLNGKIVYRVDGDTNLTGIDLVKTQVVDGKLVVNVSGFNANQANSDSPDDFQIEKYMVIDKDGNVEYSTKDASTYKG